MPTKIEEYLQRSGWTQVKRQEDLAALWVRTDDASGRELKVIVPLDLELGDYASRVADVLRVLEALEKRSAQEVFRAMKGVGEQSDEFEIAIERDDIVGGLIPLSVGAKAFRGARDIFVAAAAAEHEPQAVHPSTLSAMAQEAMRHTFLSQTREGSYVINIVSKVPSQPQPPLPNLGLEDDKWEPVQRKVFKRVAIALEAVRQAATEDTTDAFASRITVGVSWNLCQAVTRFAGGRHFRRVSFTPKWASDVPRPTDIPERIIFYPKMITAVRAGAQVLREIRPIPDFNLVGKVVELKSRSDQEHEGTAVVEGFIDATSLRRVSMELRGEEHTRAVQAYETKEEVLCVGTLYSGVQTHRLITVKVFKFAHR
ncbi:hypothetical protein [Archangium sp.]|uniref:hypothetical protein n=1 Tax=Archangium sp. TaxID=1872627 RepID=UPI002D66A534|nr:hypothetical protein [Archangium sp.]HYO53400.1 hypothetical protein [Archangium sp.]